MVLDGNANTKWRGVLRVGWLMSVAWMGTRISEFEKSDRCGVRHPKWMGGKLANFRIHLWIPISLWITWLSEHQLSPRAQTIDSFRHLPWHRFPVIVTPTVSFLFSGSKYKIIHSAFQFILIHACPMPLSTPAYINPSTPSDLRLLLSFLLNYCGV